MIGVNRMDCQDEREPKSETPESRGGARRRLFRRLRRFWKIAAIVALALVLLIPRSDDFRLTPVERIASERLFSLMEWEVANFPRKWVHMAGNLLPGAKPSRDERLAIVDDYLEAARRADKEKRRIEGAARTGGFGGASAASASAAVADDYLRELLAEKRRLQPEAEEAVEAEVSAVLASLGFQSRIGLIWPPVDFRFAQPPRLLVISPRDEINMVGGVFLDPEIAPFDRDALENRVVDELDYSAYVDNIAGLATFPNMVNDLYSTRTILRTVAHEWLHAYWVFHPFGRNYFASAEMTTLNETAATLAGDELGDMVFERMGGDLSDNARRYAAQSQADPNFTAFMRETRLEAERLLADGMIEEAEDYMRKRQWDLRLRGYYIRKLNQAYFAFRGRYADSAASVSPIGDKMRELRSHAADIGEFIEWVSEVSTPAEFDALLERVGG